MGGVVNGKRTDEEFTTRECQTGIFPSDSLDSWTGREEKLECRWASGIRRRRDEAKSWLILSASTSSSVTLICRRIGSFPKKDANAGLSSWRPRLWLREFVSEGSGVFMERLPWSPGFSAIVLVPLVLRPQTAIWKIFRRPGNIPVGPSPTSVPDVKSKLLSGTAQAVMHSSWVPHSRLWTSRAWFRRPWREVNEVFEHEGHLRRYILASSCPLSPFLLSKERSRVDERIKRNEGLDFVVLFNGSCLRGGRRIGLGGNGGGGSWESRMSDGASITRSVSRATLRTVSGVAFPPTAWKLSRISWHVVQDICTPCCWRISFNAVAQAILDSRVSTRRFLSDISSAISVSTSEIRESEYISVWGNVIVGDGAGCMIRSLWSRYMCFI